MRGVAGTATAAQQTDKQDRGEAVGLASARPVSLDGLFPRRLRPATVRLRSAAMKEIPADLPGSDLIEAGLSDLREGRVTESSLLVQLAASRLRPLGIEVEPASYGGEGAESPEHRLYDLLCDQLGDGAYGRYRALLARVASFASAVENAAAR